MMGRVPSADDLLIPLPPEHAERRRKDRSSEGMRSKTYVFKRLRDDLAMLKLRHRRGHDLRRAMISLARTDGARKDILELCAHTPRKGSTIDLYTTFPGKALCEEVSKLKVQRRTRHGDVVPLRGIAGGASESAPAENQALASAASYVLPTAGFESLESNMKKSGGAGSRIPPGDVGFDLSRSVSEGSAVGEAHVAAGSSPVSIGLESSRGRMVERQPFAVEQRLVSALNRWMQDHDARPLRRELLRLVSELDD